MQKKKTAVGGWNFAWSNIYLYAALLHTTIGPYTEKFALQFGRRSRATSATNWTDYRKGTKKVTGHQPIHYLIHSVPVSCLRKGTALAGTLRTRGEGRQFCILELRTVAVANALPDAKRGDLDWPEISSMMATGVHHNDNGCC